MNASGTKQDDLHDAQLWRALEHAPDHHVAPDWRLRKAILKRAHDAIGALDPEEAEAELELAAHSGWQGIFVRRGKRSRMPWKAAFVGVLVAVVVAVFWRREPAPIPRLDTEARVTAAAPLTKESLTPSSVEGASAERSTDAATSSTPPAVAEAPDSVAEPAPEPPLPPEPPPSPTVQAPKAQEAAAPQVPPEPEGQRVVSPLPPPAPAPTQGNAVARLVVPDSPSARSGKEVDASAQSPSANVDQSPAAVKAAPPPSSVRTDATDPPTFAALSQWSRIRISRRGGQSRSFPRADALDLNALLGSAALSAVGPQALKATPEWRVTLERNGEVLAVFEIAASQVRWREGKTPAATGVPSGPALSALRDALSNAMQQPEPSAPSESPQTP